MSTADNYFKIEHNVATGEIKKIELNDEEIAELKAQAERAQLAADAEAERLASKNAVLDKLGLTADEVAALLG